MAADESDGLLNQEDINAALAAAGLANEVAAGGAAKASAPDGQSGGSAPPKADARVDSSGRPFDEVAAAMAAAIESEAAARPEADFTAAPARSSSDAEPFEVPELDRRDDAGSGRIQGIDLLRDVELDVKIELGRSRMLVDDVLRLHEGSVVELDKLAGDPVDVFVNNRLVARGEVLVLNDNFCVRINDVTPTEVEEK